MSERVQPTQSKCRDCGEAIYWAKMLNGKGAGKKWPIDVEPDMDKGRVVLTVNSDTGDIKGTHLEKGKQAPDGALLRSPHFITCKNKPDWTPPARQRGGPPKQVKDLIPKEPTKEEIDGWEFKEERTGNLPPEIDPDTIPF
jgi:hypothetical protein